MKLSKFDSFLHFTYSGTEREVEPFCYGTSRAGDEVLRAYLISGGSGHSGEIGWQLFRLDKVENLEITEDVFLNDREGYTPYDLDIRVIYAQI